MALLYIRGLPDTSLTAALVQGNDALYGWGQDRHLLADIFDAINDNTILTGNFKPGTPSVSWPRPKTAEQLAASKVTVKDLWMRLSSAPSEGRKT